MNLTNEEKSVLTNFLSTNSPRVEETPIIEQAVTPPVIVPKVAEDDLFIQETSIQLMPVKKERISVNEDKLKAIIIPMIRDDKSFMEGLRGECGQRGRDGESVSVDNVVSVLTESLTSNNLFLEAVKGPEPEIEMVTKNVVRALKNDTKFLNLVKPEQAWPSGGGLGVNDVVDIVNTTVDKVLASTVFNSVHFNTNDIPNPVYEEGLLFYDYENKTHAGYDNTTDVTTQYGQELHVRTFNITTNTLANGVLIAASTTTTSASDDVLHGRLAISDLSDATSLIGMATHDISSGTIGKMTTNGTVGGLNTSAFTKGTELYLSHTNPGEYVSTPPPAPYGVVEVGYVTKSHPTEGKILITINKLSLNVVNEKLIHVATNGTDTSAVNGSSIKPYKTIGFALTQITDASAFNRYTILISPGIYPENNPITTKSYINIKGIDIAATVVTGINEDTLINQVQNVVVSDMSLNNSLTQSCVETITSGDMAINNVYILSAGTGVKVSHPDVNISLTDFSGFGGGDRLIDVQSGSCYIRNIGLIPKSNFTNGIHVSGSNAECRGYSYLDTSDQTVNSIKVAGYGKAVLKNGIIKGATHGMYLEECNTSLSQFTMDGCEFGIYVPATAVDTSAYLSDTEMYNCTNDVHILSPNAIVGGGGVANSTKMNIHPASKTNATFIDINEGDEGFTIIGELHVGHPTKGSESVFGEGDSYSSGIMILTSGVGQPLTDVTTSAVSLTGSSFGFPNTSIDSVIYMGSALSSSDNEPLQHYGIKHNCLSAYNTGSIVSEYFTATGWQEFRTMTSEGNAPYLPEADKIFNHVGQHQIRYNAFMLDTQLKSDPVGYGNDLYWIRYRVSSTIDQSPVFEQIKLHNNRTEINADGWVEYFGKARPIARLPWSWTGMQQAYSSLGNQDISISKKLDIGRLENQFNSDGDRVGFVGDLPLDCDTSTPIRLTWIARSESTGSSTWTVRWGYTTAGDSIYITELSSPVTHPTEQSVVLIQDMTTDVQTGFRVEIDVSKIVSRRPYPGFPDTLWVTLECTTRPGGTNVAGIDINGYYLKWCEGGHI